MRAETIAVRILGRRSQSLLTPKVSGLPRKARCGRSREWPSWSELEGARGDHQHDVIPGEPPESLKVWARCSYGLAQLQAHTTAGGGAPTPEPPAACGHAACGHAACCVIGGSHTGTFPTSAGGRGLACKRAPHSVGAAGEGRGRRHSEITQNAEERIQKLRKNAFRDYAKSEGSDYKNQRLRVDSEHRRV